MKKALKIYLKNKNLYNEKLEKIYNHVPSGSCSGCGNCCFESVGASYTEAFNIYLHLKDKNLLDEKLLGKMLEYYFDIYTQRHRCPFLNEKKLCIVYSVRPLNCRIYGHWTKKQYNENYKRLQKENRKTAEIFKENADILIDENYTDFKIPYCENFLGDILSKDERNNLYDSLIKADSDFIMSSGLDIEFKDKGVIEHILSIIFREKKLEQIHMDYLKNNDKVLLNKKIDRLINIARLCEDTDIICTGGKNV